MESLRRQGQDVTTLKLATLDHLIPVTYAGAEEMKNYVAACEECNIDRARSKIAQDKKDLASSAPKVQRPDMTRYIQMLPWHLPPDVPKAACLVLLTHPSHWKIHLSQVGWQKDHPVLIGKSGILDFPDVWWCSLDELSLPKVDTSGGKG